MGGVELFFCAVSVVDGFSSSVVVVGLLAHGVLDEVCDDCSLDVVVSLVDAVHICAVDDCLRELLFCEVSGVDDFLSCVVVVGSLVQAVVDVVSDDCCLEVVVSLVFSVIVDAADDGGSWVLVVAVYPVQTGVDSFAEVVNAFYVHSCIIGETKHNYFI